MSEQESEQKSEELSRPEPKDGPRKLSPAERISLYEAKAAKYHDLEAHYNKKAGQIKRLLKELGIETI